MSINSKINRSQQQRIQQHAKNTESYEFFNVLTSPELLSQMDDLLPEHRERHYPPTETLSMFLAQALSVDRSCQHAVNQAVVRRITEGLSPISVATGAYCKARKRLPLSMITELVHATGMLIEQRVPKAWRWKEKTIYLIDGTTLTMPDTQENQAQYPQQGGQKAELGFPICRLLGVISLSSGAIMDAAIGRFKGKGSDEQTLLRSVLDGFTANDVIVGDAFYGSYFLLASLQSKKVDAVFEQMGARKRVTDFRKGKRLGVRDHIVELSKPTKKPDWMTLESYELAPSTLKVRELKVGGKILITTFLSTLEATRDELKALYKQRWSIEVDFRHLKTTLGMDVLSCKTPDMAEKEIWIYFLAYNIIRILMAQAAKLNDILPRQISFKHALQLWLSCYRQQLGAEAIGLVLLVMGQKRVGNRAGRIEPRALKRRPKAYPLLTKPRAQARENVKKNGHPKKIK
jgi:Transposase DDE domain